MNTRRTFAALVLLGTTLSLTGLAASSASALSATSPFCKAAGQLPITLAYFDPTATPTQVAAVLKTDSAVNTTALRLLAADATGYKATTMSKNIQYYTGFAVSVATNATPFAAALAANPTSATAIKNMAGAAGFSEAIAGNYASLLITLHLTQSKVCPNIHPIVTTPTTTTTFTTSSTTTTTLSTSSTTTTSTTSTTTLPSGPPSPGPVHISLVNKAAHSLSVHWTSPHTPGVLHAYLQVAPHANCSGTTRLATASYAPSRNVMSAIINAAGPKMFVPVAKYYVRVILQRTSGKSEMVSQCMALGRI